MWIFWVKGKGFSSNGESIISRRINDKKKKKTHSFSNYTFQMEYLINVMISLQYS